MNSIANALSPGLKILIVDDDPTTRALLRTLALQLGHEPIIAESGMRALEMFRAERPDVVLLDILLPDIDGPRVMLDMRASSGDRWVPIIFVTTVSEISTHAEMLGQGGDDYLIKPVHESILRAKLEVMRRTISLHRQLEQTNRELQCSHEAAEQEKRAVRDLMRGLIRHEHLSDPMLEQCIFPAETFSGDLVAAARTPGGQLHVLLADGAGHGLAAALNVLPIAPSFYTMTGKGLSLELIAATLNRTIREYLPIERFVAATLISIDFAERRVKVWNGGNPPLLALNAEGEVFARFSSRHLALGILPPELFSTAMDELEYRESCQLFAYSDGVVESFDSGNCDGQQTIEELLLGIPLKIRMKLLRNRIGARHAERRADDDMTVVLVRCEDHNVDRVYHPQVARNEQENGERRFEITFTDQDFRELDVVEIICQLIMMVPAARAHRGQLAVIVSELYSNALDHGLLGLDSELRDVVDGMVRYTDERAAALAKLNGGRITVSLDLRTEAGLQVLVLRFRDSGPGFNFERLTQAIESNPKLHGRGIALLRALCAHVDYRGRGNEVTVRYRLEGKKEEEVLRAPGGAAVPAAACSST